ncbi:hypothetical protein F8388_015549 [Cannabis sativa]|uniref:Uncharacterized protein n=1 Tax=Cannabis sativa TaxID=3483 RepID=A0A7J6GIL8_CANSA|nr:hypothetical protein F8388_015549 [Cannabis sativa]
MSLDNSSFVATLLSYIDLSAIQVEANRFRFFNSVEAKCITTIFAIKTISKVELFNVTCWRRESIEVDKQDLWDKIIK